MRFKARCETLGERPMISYGNRPQIRIVDADEVKTKVINGVNKFFIFFIQHNTIYRGGRQPIMTKINRPFRVIYL
jgi:hypothetical protein